VTASSGGAGTRNQGKGGNPKGLNSIHGDSQGQQLRRRRSEGILAEKGEFHEGRGLAGIKAALSRKAGKERERRKKGPFKKKPSS